MEGREREVLYYQSVSGEQPFKEWRDRISDDDLRAIIYARVGRLRGSNFGDSKSVGGGVSENRIHLGSGYRIYYGVDGNNVVLLCAGEKSTQDADIITAKDYWSDYKKRKRDREKGGLKNVGPPKRSSKRPKK